MRAKRTLSVSLKMSEEELEKFWMDGRLLFHDSKPSSKLGLNADSVIRRGLNSLLAAASYAKRPTAPRRKSIVPGWIAVSFQFDLVPAQSDAVHHQLPPLILPYHQILFRAVRTRSRLSSFLTRTNLLRERSQIDSCLAQFRVTPSTESSDLPGNSDSCCPGSVLGGQPDMLAATSLASLG